MIEPTETIQKPRIDCPQKTAVHSDSPSKKDHPGRFKHQIKRGKVWDWSIRAQSNGLAQAVVL